MPVWVYIQGGGYQANSNANYVGTGVVVASEQSIVFVNFNYRVGCWGLLAGEKVKEDGDLNVGLQDQRAALQWVQRHIAKVSIQLPSPQLADTSSLAVIPTTLSFMVLLLELARLHSTSQQSELEISFALGKDLQSVVVVVTTICSSEQFSNPLSCLLILPCLSSNGNSTISLTQLAVQIPQM